MRHTYPPGAPGNSSPKIEPGWALVAFAAVVVAVALAVMP